MHAGQVSSLAACCKLHGRIAWEGRGELGQWGRGGGVGNARWGFGTYVEGGQCCLWFGARLLVGRRLVVMRSGQKKRQEASKRTVWSEILLIVMSRSANGVPDTAVLVSMVRHIHPSLPARRLSHLALSHLPASSQAQRRSGLKTTYPPRRDEITPGTTPPQTSQGARYRRRSWCVRPRVSSRMTGDTHRRWTQTYHTHTPITLMSNRFVKWTDGQTCPACMSAGTRRGVVVLERCSMPLAARYGGEGRGAR